jgi:hypothetical protein
VNGQKSQDEEGAQASETSGGRSSCEIQRIELGRHDEVIAMEATDFVRPQGHRHAAPFGQDGRMMSFFFRHCANSIGKAESVSEIAEPKNSLQSLNPVTLLKHPLGNLGLKLVDLELSHARRVPPAGSTLFFAQYAYRTHR